MIDFILSISWIELIILSDKIKVYGFQLIRILYGCTNVDKNDLFTCRGIPTVDIKL